MIAIAYGGTRLASLRGVKIPWLLAALAGCDSGHTLDIAPTLRLADRSQAELARLVHAASGGDLDDALASAGAAPLAGRVVTSPQADGFAIVRFEQWTVATPAGQATYDGSARVWLPFTAGCQFDDVDLTVDRDGVVVRSELSLSCEADPAGVCDNECVLPCRLQHSGLELVGAGGVLAAGQWRYLAIGSPCRQAFLQPDEITLQGIDSLTLTP